MSERVLALKYRPICFEQLIGQAAVSRTLSLALDSNRISHAYLFSGLRGSGKTSSARIFSKSLICDNGPTSKPCEVCPNCTSANEGRHIDIIEMDAASSRKIDDIRELIEHTKYKPSTARFKIFIIDEVHMLTKEAFNALLKTLEEPPTYVKFILATTDPLKLPPTILSRTQHFRFIKISKSDIVNHLEFILNSEGITYQKEALEIIARSGGGSLRDTLTLLDQAIIFSKGNIDAISTAEMLGIVDPEFIEQLFETILKRDEKALKELIIELENYEAEAVLDEITVFLKERYEDGDTRFSPMLLERFFRVIASTKSLLALNSDGSFVLALTFFKMLESLKIKEIDEMIKELESEITVMPVFAKSQVLPSAPKAAAVVDKSVQKFDELVQKIYDRNYDLGKCFEHNIKYLEFNNGTLKWISRAKDECKKLLSSNYAIIKQLVWEAYGIDTKIEPIKEEFDKVAPKEEPLMEEKSEELLFNSCSSPVPDVPLSSEPDPKDILNHPMIEKTKELFNPKRILISSKV